MGGILLRGGGGGWSEGTILKGSEEGLDFRIGGETVASKGEKQNSTPLAKSIAQLTSLF